MKSDDIGKKLTELLKKLKTTDVELPIPPDPVSQVVLGFLQWNVGVRRADIAYATITSSLVDHNELRVTPVDQIVELIGEDYPNAQERVVRMLQVLNAIYVREHAVSLDRVATQTKKEQRLYLDTLPGMPAYVAATVMLICFGGHAVPVDEKLAALLAAEGVIDFRPPAEVESALLRQIKADDALEAHVLLQQWSDSKRFPAQRTLDRLAGVTTAAGKPAKTTTKKSRTTKKTTSAKKSKTSKTTKKSKAIRKKTVTRKKKSPAGTTSRTRKKSDQT